MEAHPGSGYGVDLAVSSPTKLSIQDIPGKGRGVFSGKEIFYGDVIEECPVLVISAEESCHIDQTRLYDYYWEWSHESIALALGYGSLYNHSETPNARVMKDYTRSTMKIVCIRDIKSGEEITVHYGSVWFKIL